MSEFTDKLKEISKGMPSILTEFPDSKFRDSDSIVDAIRDGKRTKIPFNIGKTCYKVKPYWEVFDYMMRLYKWQESGKNIQDGRGWEQLKNPFSPKTGNFRKPVAFRIDPTAKKQKAILGEMF
jgi:hypothetical protein